MRTTANTTVRDDHGTVIAGNDDSEWIAVHPADPLDALFVEVCSRSIAPELDHKAEGAALAAFSGKGDHNLHRAMVDDSYRHSLRVLLLGRNKWHVVARWSSGRSRRIASLPAASSLTALVVVGLSLLELPGVS